MAEELFKNVTKPAVDATKQPTAPATEANQTSSGATNVAPPLTKPVEGDAASTTQTPTTAEQTASLGSAKVPEDDEDDLQKPTELDMLKRRAQLMGISFSNNIGVDALKAKIKSVLDGEKQEPEVSEIPSTDKMASVENVEVAPAKPTKKISLREHLRREKLKLVRVRITNLDPKKKDLPGEIITVANEYIGTVRKFVPFGEVTDNGYHIPQCIYDMLKERTFISIKTRRGPKGEQIVEHQNAREFSLEVLPMLTDDERAKLAAAQQAAGGV